jgi:serine/threonine protein phosphatase PrpC
MRRGERMNTIFLTDRGKKRQHNEDSVGIFSNKNGDILVVVADGMGGHRAGDIASTLTVDNLKSFWEQTSEFQKAEEAEKWMEEHIKKLNTIIFEYGAANADCQGMGTTIEACICTKNFATIGHIGDSRGYVLNSRGFSQITEDHSLVMELVRSGQITKEDAEHHPRKNVLIRALGTEKIIEVDVKTIILEANDCLLLCSDGLTNKLSESELGTVLTEEISLDEKANKLVALANDRGGEDNITLAIVEYTVDE